MAEFDGDLSHTGAQSGGFAADNSVHNTHHNAGGDAPRSTGLSAHGQTPVNHLGTSVPSGGLDGAHHDPEKVGHDGLGSGEKTAVDDDEDGDIEDIDALIDDLESQDGEVDEEEEEVTEQGGARPVSEEMLNTDTRTGLTEAEVSIRRKKYGLNQMKEEKENLILKFLGYFVGPIQFVMEVCNNNGSISNEQKPRCPDPHQLTLRRSTIGCRYPRRWSQGLGRLRSYLRFAAS